MTKRINEIESALLVEAIYQRWGHDFRDYKSASLNRQIQRIVKAKHLSLISASNGI
jgi:chemotaxis protein methyltransferase CheR